MRKHLQSQDLPFPMRRTPSSQPGLGGCWAGAALHHPSPQITSPTPNTGLASPVCATTRTPPRRACAPSTPECRQYVEWQWPGRQKLASSQSAGSPASVKPSSSRDRGRKALPLRWLPTLTCTGSWKPAKTTAVQRPTMQSCWSHWSAASRTCGPTQTGWSPPTMGSAAWPAAGSSPHWRHCWSMPNMASEKASAARSFLRRCWRGGRPRAKGRTNRWRKRNKAFLTVVNVPGPRARCFFHSRRRGRRRSSSSSSSSSELEVRCPPLPSPAAPGAAPSPVSRNRDTWAGREDQGLGGRKQWSLEQQDRRGRGPSPGHSISTSVCFKPESKAEGFEHS
ncbi:hypothetical protein GHT09_005689 [Marmota monax]|uniref:Uncharacterized protein n=1 Tax=Marmota monax TaxID=9995 RepID=A0A834UMN4_MARMO|nr:hypothetical protein GHT09_005689 [Marmota monax]